MNESSLTFAEYTVTLMDYAYGEGWRGIFDLIITTARKPSFFVDSTEFYGSLLCFEFEFLPLFSLSLSLSLSHLSMLTRTIEWWHHPADGILHDDVAALELKLNGMYKGGVYHSINARSQCDSNNANR